MPIPLRILYGAAPELGPGAAAGFSHWLIPPPVPGLRRGDRFLAACAEAALGPPVLARGAGGLSLLLDATLDAVAAHSALAAAGPFRNPDPDAVLDPRLPADPAAAQARLTEEAALGAWWGTVLAGYAAQGVAGFRLLGLAQFPAETLPALLAPLRRALPRALLLGWAPGMSAAQVAALSGAGLDGLFGSLPWWDFSAGWFWDEWARLHAVAPVLGAPEVPFGPAANPARWSAAAAVGAFAGAGWLSLRGDGSAAALNRALVREALPGDGVPGLPLGGAGPVLALLRCDAADARFATRAGVALVNTDTEYSRPIPALAAAFSGRFRVAPAGPALRPGEWRFLAAARAPAVPAAAPPDAAAAKRAAASPRLAVEACEPCVDGGAFPVKRIAGERVRVRADVVFDGHDQIAVALRWREPGPGEWQETPMRPLGNDRWEAEFPLAGLGRHEYRVVAWRDEWESWRDEVGKKHAAGVDTRLELVEGEALIRRAAARSPALRDLLGALVDADADTKRQTMLGAELRARMAEADNRPHLSEGPAIAVDAERIGARTASWYEVFPRSLSDDPNRHGSFRDVIRHLPRIAALGFDVLYFPPVHPIGRINRKGRNNSLAPAPDDPGSPYAIGAAEGGHDALHPELGSFEDFAALRAAAATHGLEIALDIAVQCSPDHPWLRQHKGWFDWRPDGSIKYAENPPKKYQDIVNVDFYAADAVPGLWLELLRTVLFWCGHGVRIFRVDNPHTKPFPFWEWLIAETRARHPEAIFLAEAFTRPKIMYRLAKIGFSQSYTYFTWRNAKAELTEYLTELADGPPREFLRPHFFVNTPDINPVFLQNSGRAGFLIRAALAATLSGLWGVYNGFELCEAAALPGREEYLDSEKFQLRAWDWERPGNIVAEIAALNRARRLHPALRTHLGVTFLNAGNDAVLYYEKSTPDRSDVVLAAVSLDPHNAQSAMFEVPTWRWQLPDDGAVAAEDLMTGETFTWRGRDQRLTLTPERPFRLWRARPAVPGAANG